ncbi:hypothetical protein CL630_00145 [bacterium]|nr:hypothetical protein [bacterium]|tara:strand:- start:16367 stop:17665 length:1299 start_codon:yes stop_codon:yes gene_type:complete
MIKTLAKKIIITVITLEARIVLRKYKPEVVAITGNVGKTATKDAICAVLSRNSFIGCGKKSFNSEIGIPLSVLGCENAWGSIRGWLKIIFEGLSLIFFKNHYPRTLVIEVGTDKPGDIKKITSWLTPDVVVVTSFPNVPVHIEFFDSREALIDEKTHLVHALKKEGLLVLNADDKEVLALKEIFPHKTLTFSIGSSADIILTDPRIEYDRAGILVGMFGRVAYRENTAPLRIKEALGRHLFYSMLAAFAVGVGKSINFVTALESLSDFRFPSGRLNILDGINQSIILDDSYNASPIAMHAALDTLAEITVHGEGRKIAVFGDMLELGKHSAEEHKKVGAQVAEMCDVLVTVGVRAQFIREMAHKKRMKKKQMFHFDTSEKAGEFLKDFVEPNDVVLIKGSQSIRMEKAVKHILRSPGDSKFLVRQEKEWENH